MKLQFSKKFIQNVLIPLGLIVGYFVILFLTKAHSTCIFKNIYGVPCPSCGITRSYIQLFQFHFRKAFFYHPLFWFFPFLFFVVLFRFIPVVNKIYNNKLFWIISLIIILGIWVIRMFLYFPSIEPLDYNKYSIFYKIYSILK